MANTLVGTMYGTLRLNWVLITLNYVLKLVVTSGHCLHVINDT